MEKTKVIVVLPAFNAAKTLRQTWEGIPKNLVDEIILVDDCSIDNTIKVANELGITVIPHALNLGYGGNQKTCYKLALERDADIIIMLHPDYQYPPELVPVITALLSSGKFDIAIGSRILGGKAVKYGMPVYKYISNRILTLVQNLFLGVKLSEYHSGYRGFTREALMSIPFTEFHDGFVFDAEMLSAMVYRGFSIGEFTSPCRYHENASSINLLKSINYGIGCITLAMQFRLARLGMRTGIFRKL
ncbi:MAG: glycosyltransferase family 2 protein [Ignavibacteria bacterium]|nr:glycosyltransferase family 2 protein [Ignavibacteria bacterium]